MMEHYYWNDEIFDENWFSYPDLYKQVVEEFPSGSKFVEVGSWKGRSSSFLAVEICNSGKDIEFYCVDTWEDGPDHQNYENLDDLYKSFLENMKPVKDYYIPVRTTSEEASKKFEDRSLDFVFLDASHEYEDIKNDIEKWLPKVKPGGILAGHDYYPDGSYDWFPGVKKAVKEKFNNFENKENCWIYRVPPLQEKELIKVLFFGRHTKDGVWEYDFILNELLPKDKIPIIKFLQLDEVQLTNIEFDVFVYSSRDPNNYPWGYMPTYEEVLECVLKTKPKVIIQISDEFYYEDLRQHNNLGNHCQLFLRQHHHHNYQYTENTIQLPLAYCNDTPIKNKIIQEIRYRDLDWSFIGNIKSDRSEMIEKFKSLDNHFISSSSSKEEMVDIYNRSIFVPSGRGNSSLNCYRLYEASMCGAIPVVVGSLEEIEITFKYEENPPWIFAESWDEAVEKCRDLLINKNKLQEIQTSILEWWNKRISRIQEKVNQVFSEQTKDDSYKLKNFPPVHFISTKESEDRRKVLYDQFKSCGIVNVTPHIFEKGCNNGKIINSKHWNNDGILTDGINWNYYLGALLSHFKTIKEWYETTDEQYAFFCEDDISFETVKYWNFTWEQFFNMLPKDWECVQLVLLRFNGIESVFNSEVYFNNRSWDDWSATGYLISREHARKIVETYYNGNNQFDSEYKGIDKQEKDNLITVTSIESLIYTLFKENTIFSFPLFAENNYFKSTWNSKQVLGDIRDDAHIQNINWWKVKGINYSLDDIFSSFKLKNFPPINFISVNNSEERRKLLYEKFKKYNLTNIRPHIFEVYDDEKHHYVGNGYNNLIGIGRGPTTSHLKAIKDWYFDTEEEYAFFCEDDISFETVKYWNFTWEEFFNNLPKDWECVQLCWVREFNMFIFSDNGLKLRHRCWCDWSACAYLIKRTHAKKLISNYYRNGSFNLDFVGNDSHVRPQWAKNPVAETIVFSPLGNPKDSTINTSVIYGFPLFLEDYYRCDSDLLVYDKQNSLYPIRYKNEYSYNEILNWWKNKGKNLKIEDIIDI